MLIHEEQEEQKDICLYMKNKKNKKKYSYTIRTRKYILIH